jgi:hypothetical protein
MGGIPLPPLSGAAARFNPRNIFIFLPPCKALATCEIPSKAACQIPIPALKAQIPISSSASYLISLP